MSQDKLKGVGLEKDSLHVLKGGNKEVVFRWTGQEWSTPGTGYGTRPAWMAALGWSYVKPLEKIEEIK